MYFIVKTIRNYFWSWRSWSCLTIFRRLKEEQFHSVIFRVIFKSRQNKNNNSFEIWRFNYHFFSDFLFWSTFTTKKNVVFLTYTKTLLTQDVIWTSIRRFLNVMDARWTSKQRLCLLGNSEWENPEHRQQIQKGRR